MRLTLTRRAEYGIRALIELAGQPGDRVTATELARRCDIPAGNLPTIVNTLARARLVDARPGRQGGCRLARSPDSITMLEIVECLEGGSESTVCILGARQCGDAGRECSLHEAWKEGRSAALGALAALTLAEAARRHEHLVESDSAAPTI